MSHPTWVRGLKQKIFGITNSGIVVAPYVGAWIETYFFVLSCLSTWSHPTWVRGLKRVRACANI